VERVELSAETRGLSATSVRARGEEGEPAVTEVAGAAAAERLLGEKDLPTALVTYNDRVAVGILLTLRSRGVRVPQDLSIVGYDDTRFAGLGPIALTSVHQDMDRLARAALDCALGRTNGRQPAGDAARILVTPRLVVRSTTSPPRL
jgi:DNA-binding LacI/PurR family transcriptional regulator